MSMNEARHKKLKWSRDPRNLSWVHDQNRYSINLMKKMGWKGKGIGLNENGRSQNIRAEMRPNLLGLGGSNDYADTWMDQQDTYRALLQNLNNVTDEEKKNFKIREVKEEYKKGKYGKAKDITTANSSDLKCILGGIPGMDFGLPKLGNIKIEPEEESDKSDGKYKISEMNIYEYFESKNYSQKLLAVRTGQSLAPFRRKETKKEIEDHINNKMKYIKIKKESGVKSLADVSECKKKKRKKLKKAKVVQNEISVNDVKVENVLENPAKKSKKKKKKTASKVLDIDEKESEGDETKVSEKENKSYEISENKKKSVSSKKNKKRKIVEKLNYEVENSLKKIKKKCKGTNITKQMKTQKTKTKE